MGRWPREFSRSAPSRTRPSGESLHPHLVNSGLPERWGRDGQVESADTIHIYSSDETVAQSLKQLVGKSVKVKGNPFGAHTAHHHAPIVMEITEINSN